MGRRKAAMHWCEAWMPNIKSVVLLLHTNHPLPFLIWQPIRGLQGNPE